MKRRSLWQLSVTTTPEAEDAVTELLGNTFGQPVAAYTDLETGVSTVTRYFDTKPDWSAVAQANLRAALQRLKTCGLALGPGRVRLRALRARDWAESWKRHFRPLEIGSALLIKPSWSRQRPRAGQALLVLDPGLSFGTGQHPTTAFCLEQLAAWRRVKTRQSLLDLGTGSGILAIAAAKLGYAPIAALDVDPEAVRVARANARRNRVAGRIRFSRQDLTRMARRPVQRHAVVCANLMADLLLAERERILARLEPGGLLVLAGILKTEFAGVRAAYEARGLRLVASQTRNEWRSGSFTAP
jgi:ribosomal protein L11 methyltransferase